MRYSTVFVFLVSFFPLFTQAKVCKGNLVDLLDFEFVYLDDLYEENCLDHAFDDTNIVISWSSASSISAYIYGINDDEGTETALSNEADICKITNASQLSFKKGSVGPVSSGINVIFRNIDTGYYAALTVGNFAQGHLKNSSYYIDYDGKGDFSSVCH